MVDREGIVVIGAPRSGTTLIRGLLDAHPDVVCPPETTILSACARLLEEHELDPGVPAGVRSALGPLGVPEDTVLERLRAFAFSFHRDLAKAQGASRWAMKTATDSFHLAEIEPLCGGHVHWVGVVRHGLDVVASMDEWVTRSGGWAAELHRYVADDPRPAHAYAKAWSAATADVLDLCARREDAVLVRYEDLVEQPEREVSRLLEALGLLPAPGLSERALFALDEGGIGDWKTWARTSVDPTSVGRWRRDLPHELKAALGPIVNPVLQQGGYEPVRVKPRAHP